MTNNFYFFDTSALLQKSNNLFKKKENIIISTTVLDELENIKTSRHKDDLVKQQAKTCIRKINDNIDKCEIINFNETMLEPFKKMSLEITNDIKILSAAFWANNNLHIDEIVFVTNDLSLMNIANLFFGDDQIIRYEEEPDDYSGYKVVECSDEVLAQLYQGEYHLDGLINEYFILKNIDGEVVDKIVKTEDGFRTVGAKPFKSTVFGEVKPFNKDIYQQLAFDSLSHNQITMLKGPAGTGKSMIALSYLFYKLEKHEIDKIIIFCNPIATKGAARLGFYPGDKDTKLLDSQIGNFLSSKFGDKCLTQQYLSEGKLCLVPMADLRGYDTSGMRAGIYITEAQNTDVNLMKLAMQRVGEDSIVIVDGDYNAQVDLDAFTGDNNGMKSLSKAFRGESVYGEIELKNIYRSKIARIAEKMI